MTRSFSNRSQNPGKSSPVFPPDPQEKRANRVKSVGSFKTSMGAFGPLVDGPDYTFLDGRPTPLRKGQQKRAKSQREAAAKVLQLMKETQFAIQMEQQQRQEQQQTKQKLLETKLKPKGHKMLQD